MHYLGLLSGIAFVLRRLMPIFSWSSVTALARPVSCGGSSCVELPVLFLAAFSLGAALGPAFEALAGWGAGADALRFPGHALQVAAHACPGVTHTSQHHHTSMLTSEGPSEPL